MEWRYIKESEQEWFEYLMDVSNECLYVEALRYFQRLHEHPTISPHLVAMLKEDQIAKKSWEATLQEERPELFALFDVISDAHPEWDHPADALIGQRPNPDYLNSFQRIRDIREAKDPRLGTPIFPGFYDDNSEESLILGILRGRLQQFLHDNQSTNATQEINPETNWLHQINRIEERHSHGWKRWRNQMRTSGGFSYLYLHHLTETINPIPRLPHTLQEFINDPWSYAGSLGTEDIANTVYRDQPPKADRITEVRQHLMRVHVALRSQLSQPLIAEQIVGKYKTRAMWYDKERLLSLVKDEAGQWIHGRELVLMNDLAKYVFDQGLPAWQRMHLQNLEPDLVVMHPVGVLVEGKVTIKCSRKDLINGIAQLLSYLNTFELSHIKILETFYVVFRLDGPLYALPNYLVLGPWIIRPLVIDLCGARNSGRRQGRVLAITESEIFDKLNALQAQDVIQDDAPSIP